jgi:hypothetical protein
MKTSFACCFPVFLVCVVSGCEGPDPTVKQLPPPPHGGTLITLPETRGFAEVLSRSEKLAGGKDAKRPNATLTVYFLKADGTTAMNPEPTDVSIVLGPESGNKTVPLKPDPSKPGAFASAPGPFSNTEVSGELKATVEGQAVSVSFAIR